MKRPSPTLILSVATLLILTVSLSSAAPGAPGTPSMRWVQTSPTTAEVRADGITNGGVSGNGAIVWDVYFRIPESVATVPGITVTPGSVWTNQSPCGFQVVTTTGLPSVPPPPGSGNHGVYVSGFCNSVPTTPVTGNDVLVFSVSFTNCPPGGFTMDLSSGAGVFGSGATDMVDTAGSAFVLPDQNLTDGLACGAALAVTLANFTAVAQPDHVLVTWETVSELNNAGFNLYRDTSPAGPGVQVNSTLIPSRAPAVLVDSHTAGRTSMRLTACLCTTGWRLWISTATPAGMDR